MKVYHYSSLEYLKRVLHGAENTGLRASRRLGTIDQNAWKTAGVFALLEPTPDNWQNNEHFKLTWDALKHDVGRVLLEIEVDPEKDKAFVVDRGHVEGFLYLDKTDIPSQYLHGTREEAEKEYYKSLIPLKEYLEKKNELNYTLPEVLITESVPVEKLSISKEQPFLKEFFDTFKKGIFRDEAIEQMKQFPELVEWYEKYKEGEEGNEVKEEFKVK